MIKEPQIQFRLMTVEDLDTIMWIEKASFTAPWTADAYFNEITYNHFAYYIVAEWNDQIVGYAGVWIIVDEAHITNVAVHPQYRGMQIGEALMKQLIRLSLSYGATKMTLEVRVSNHVAQSLYKKLGFVEQGIRKGYYLDNHEDAIIMWVNLDESQEIS